MDKKRTNVRQFARLVSFMEEHPELARGGRFSDCRESVSSLWATIQAALNSLGPPTRSVAAWQKVWNDKKLQIKKKLQHNQNEVRATGGGRNTQYSFNDVEEAIIRLLSLRRTVDHNGAIFGTQSSTGLPNQEHNQELNDGPSPAGEIELLRTSADLTNRSTRTSETENEHRSTRNRGRVNQRNYRKALLEKQTNDLKELKEHVSACARYSRKSFMVHEKRFGLEQRRFQLEEEKFQFEKQIRLEEQKRWTKQLQLKRKILNYKRRKLDFEMGRTTIDALEEHNEQLEAQLEDSFNGENN
ncbi:uncharacterized protein LOC134206998 [Armigeres subalbatus]|uniref:uncharacterized protein LOC134206998 n=1 Tax=Armigeres subalbatus TaxID=124917 RepID=UPI002ED3B63E